MSFFIYRDVISLDSCSSNFFWYSLTIYCCSCVYLSIINFFFLVYFINHLCEKRICILDLSGEELLGVFYLFFNLQFHLVYARDIFIEFNSVINLFISTINLFISDINLFISAINLFISAALELVSRSEFLFPKGSQRDPSVIVHF